MFIAFVSVRNAKLSTLPISSGIRRHSRKSVDFLEKVTRGVAAMLSELRPASKSVRMSRRGKCKKGVNNN
jgi:hypothetical protein